ncbi:MAG TPA: response regulator transcription factor [Spirochaetia bacterium]|nr:response regulator transcription factor [Spirochaetia bacterium]
MKILIADDQKHARSGLKALIGATLPGAEIREASDGLEAERLCAEIEPDLVLMDVRMPGEDGLAATRWIKTRLPRTRILVLSVQPDAQAAAMEAGADGFACKCETPESLLGQIAALGFAPPRKA